jgi:hypothetical protein
MHAWDDPAETLFAQAPRLGVPLVMPRLGEPVEPSHVDRVEPWWRVVGRPERRAATVEAPAAAMGKNVPWPID